ncbi:unnamed protein product [Hydatigera taeniaeformis]|uniref:Secreted protein n=1 Tax=Hydatigena taeniaeformis TaxID=6205 RepID=A0A0R3X8B6_HYDTA|nr:unnamed protein product [Hydatigera taeniaeformis]
MTVLLPLRICTACDKVHWNSLFWNEPYTQSRAELMWCVPFAPRAAFATVERHPAAGACKPIQLSLTLLSSSLRSATMLIFIETVCGGQLVNILPQFSMSLHWRSDDEDSFRVDLA